MKIGFYSLQSAISNPEQIKDSLTDYHLMLEQNFVAEEVSREGLSTAEKYDLFLVFIKTGGTENKFKEIYDQLPKPVFLLSSPLHNSLAASMEILSWINSQGEKGRILHGTSEELVRQIKRWANIKTAVKKIKTAKLGVIGKPSDWLIDSKVSPGEVKNNWGTKIISIEIRELIEAYYRTNLTKAREISQEFIEKAEDMIENTKDDVYQAARVYLALKEIVKKYDLTGLTLRCFDLLSKLNTTGCLALAWLNDEGIVAGCEGDVPAVFTMMISYYLTGEPPFMANLHRLNKKTRGLVFAHCTLPTKSVKSYILRSHFESGIGVAIQGKFTAGPITIVKVGGEDLTQYVIKEGEIMKNLNNPDACRSQISVRLTEDSSYFVTNPIGNHHIIIPEMCKKELKDLFAIMNFNLEER